MNIKLLQGPPSLFKRSKPMTPTDVEHDITEALYQTYKESKLFSADLKEISYLKKIEKIEEFFKNTKNITPERKAKGFEKLQ